MKRVWAVTVTVLIWSSASFASSFRVVEARNDIIQIQDMELAVPEGWTLQQDAEDQGTIILGFANQDEYLTFYVRQNAEIDMHEMFVNGSSIVRDVFEYPRTGYNWKAMQTEKSSAKSTAYVSAFKTEHDGFTYFGYSRAGSAERSLEVVNTFLSNIR
jgi:hypothetical protein